MKKYLLIILVILLVILGLLTFYFVRNKEKVYQPTVEYDDDIVWDDIDKTYITFNGTNADRDGESFVLNNNVLTIKAGGSYYLSGSFDGSIVVDSKSDVYLVLNGITINATTNAAIYVLNANKTYINIVDGTTNNLTDNTNYDKTDKEINATIYSKNDLVIMGCGTLNIKTNYKYAINCKASLQIIGGNINVETANDGFKVTNE